MEENSEIPLKEKIDTIFKAMTNETKKKVKIKKIKVPRKAKVKKGKLRKGWVGVIRIDENMSMRGERQKVEGSIFKTRDGTYHATNGSEVVFWQGKYPVVFQPTWKNNPLNFTKDDNETYGQKYIMTRMLKDATLGKKNIGGNWLLWVLLAGVAIFVINKLATGGF